MKDQLIIQAPPFQPQSIEELRARVPAAMAEVYDSELLLSMLEVAPTAVVGEPDTGRPAPPKLPMLNPANCFDFPCGVRVVLCRFLVPGGAVVTEAMGSEVPASGAPSHGLQPVTLLKAHLRRLAPDLYDRAPDILTQTIGLVSRDAPCAVATWYAGDAPAA